MDIDKSVDCGSTWVNIDTDANKYGSVERDYMGRLLNVYYTTVSSVKKVYFRYSTDNGATWSTAVQVDTGIDECIPGVCATVDGKIWVFFYKTDGVSKVFKSYSVNNGATWSTPVAEI